VLSNGQAQAKLTQFIEFTARHGAA